MGKRNYRREYDLYYGEKGEKGKKTKQQKKHMKDKTCRNKARAWAKLRHGSKKIKNKDIFHTDGIACSNDPKNLKVKSANYSRQRNKH